MVFLGWEGVRAGPVGFPASQDRQRLTALERSSELAHGT